jgi:ubiquinone biosynthesis monooxygenase Coq6
MLNSLHSEPTSTDIGAWSHVQIERTCPMDEIQVTLSIHINNYKAYSKYTQVWDGISDARITFSASELGLDDRAAVITENLNLQRGLLRHLSSISEVELLDKTQVGSIQREERGEGEGWPLVHLSDGRIFRTRLLVSTSILCSRRVFIGATHIRWVPMASTLLSGLTRGSRHMGGPTTRKPSLQPCPTHREIFPISWLISGSFLQAPSPFFLFHQLPHH